MCFVRFALFHVWKGWIQDCNPFEGKYFTIHLYFPWHYHLKSDSMKSYKYFFLIFISWRLLQYLQYFTILYNIVVVFVIHWHESAMDLYVFPIPISPPTSLSTRSLWVFPVHQARALVSCIQPGLVIWLRNNAAYSSKTIFDSMFFVHQNSISPIARLFWGCNNE